MCRRLVLAISPILLACNAATSEPEPRVYTITPEAQWAGGVVTVSGFKESDPSPVLLAGADTLGVERIDDSTVRVTLPATASGATTIFRARSSRIDSLGLVRVYGYERYDLLANANVAGDLLLVERAGSPWIVGQNWGNGGQPGIVLLDVANGAVSLLSQFSVPASSYGVSVSWGRSDAFIVRDSTHQLGRWQLWPTPLLLDSVPLTTTRHLSQLSDSTFLRTTSQAVSTFRGTTDVATASAGGTNQIRISPDGRLASLAFGGSFGRAPVFEAQTGRLAYEMPSMRAVGALEFSPDGSRIAAIGNPMGTTTYFLFLVDAATGTTIDSTEVSTNRGSLAFDPVRPRLYVHTNCQRAPTVEIYNSLTLEHEGTLEGAGASPCLGDSSLAYHQLGQRLYLVEGGIPASRWTFEVLP